MKKKIAIYIVMIFFCMSISQIGCSDLVSSANQEYEEENGSVDTSEEIVSEEMISTEKETIVCETNSIEINDDEEDSKNNKTSDTETNSVETLQGNREYIESKLEVHFIDVGQGDATLFICDGEAMLLDAGNTESGTSVQLYLKKREVSNLKYLILTHPDEDHIGGADVIVTKYSIDNVFMPHYEKDTKTYEELINALEYKHYKWSTPNVGNTYALGSAIITIIAPNRSYSDVNESSIGILVTHGKSKFFFTGDAESEAENDILGNGVDIDCDVFKAGHHGSKTSNSSELLKATTPEYVVISCGEDNSYGHPHAESLNRFRSLGVKLFRTDEQGSIVVESDGTNLTWNISPSDSWKSGESIQSSQNVLPPITKETSQPTGSNFAVNGKNGKIHIVGACSATGTGKQAMEEPIYFATYEEAENYSIQHHPGQDKRRCGNCYK